MSIVELLTMVGLAAVAAYLVALSVDLRRRRGMVRIVSGSARAGSATAFRDGYVSETTPAYFQYVRRRYRYAVHCPVRYLISGQREEGVVVDMTREGWRVRGQEGMRLGMVLSMELTIPGAIGAVEVARAVVCWVQGAEFGVKIEAVDPRSAAVFSEYFSSLSQTTALLSAAA